MGINGILKMLGGLRSEKDYLKLCQTLSQDINHVYHYRVKI